MGDSRDIGTNTGESNGKEHGKHGNYRFYRAIKWVTGCVNFMKDFDMLKLVI